MAEQMKITKAGQVSVPAAIRRRWGTRRVLVEDRGDHLVMRPTPEDPIKALRGILAEQMKGGPSSEEMRRRYREEEIEDERQKRIRLGYPPDLPDPAE